jgi:hypoxanthine phosphoribosyltransferase
MRGPPVFEQKYPLPRSQLQPRIRDRDHLARSRQHHPDVRGHIVRPFRIVLEVRRVFGHEAIEKFFEITARGWVRVLHDDKAATGVPDENGQRARDDPTSGEDSGNLVRNFIGPFPGSADSDRLGMDAKRGHLVGTLTPAIGFAINGMIVDIRANMQADLERILFDEATIHRRLDELAARITHDYRDRELTVIAVLNGSIILLADLLRRIPLPLRLDCLSVASYQGGVKPSGEPIFRQGSLPDLAGRHVLILDDILDSGATLGSIREKLDTSGALSVRICVLLEKKKTRARMVEPDYVGFQIADEFVVGYGLDYMERYRNLPCIGVLRKELIAPAA